MRTERRRFMQTAALAGGAMAVTGEIPRRSLGKTGLQVSILGLGGAPVGRLPDQDTAVKLVRLCYDLGVNYFDTAAAGAYGLSQSRYGAALKAVRDRVVLSTKTRHRTYTQAELDLNQSLANLATDRIDLYQIHNVINEEDIEFIFARRGVMELVEKAKQAGKIRFVGVTGHTDPAILNRIIGQYAFDTVLMPLSVADGANHAKSFEERTLPLARKKGMGVIAMKTLGAGALLQQRVASEEEALHYVWTLPVSTAILGCSTQEQIRADARLAQTAKPLSAAAVEELRRRAAPLAHSLEPWKGIARGSEPAYRADWDSLLDEIAFADAEALQPAQAGVVRVRCLEPWRIADRHPRRQVVSQEPLVSVGTRIDDARVGRPDRAQAAGGLLRPLAELGEAQAGRERSPRNGARGRARLVLRRTG